MIRSITFTKVVEPSKPRPIKRETLQDRFRKHFSHRKERTTIHYAVQQRLANFYGVRSTKDNNNVPYYYPTSSHPIFDIVNFVTNGSPFLPLNYPIALTENSINLKREKNRAMGKATYKFMIESIDGRPFSSYTKKQWAMRKREVRHGFFLTNVAVPLRFEI